MQKRRKCGINEREYDAKERKEKGGVKEKPDKQIHVYYKVENR